MWRNVFFSGDWAAGAAIFELNLRGGQQNSNHRAKVEILNVWGGAAAPAWGPRPPAKTAPRKTPRRDFEGSCGRQTWGGSSDPRAPLQRGNRRICQLSPSVAQMLQRVSLNNFTNFEEDFADCGSS